MKRVKDDVLATLPEKSHELILLQPSSADEKLLALEKAIETKQALTPQQIS